MTPELKQKFEEMYSFSIRRGEDSTVVWGWVRDVLEVYGEDLNRLTTANFKLQGERDKWRDEALSLIKERDALQSEITSLKEQLATKNKPTSIHPYFD